MRFQTIHRSAFSARDLFEVHRDDLEHFGPALLGVRDVRQTLAERDGPLIRLRHRWTGDLEVMPWALRLVVPSFMFVWDIASTWDDRELAAWWELTSPYLGKMMRVEGRHRFEPRDAGCRVTVEGHLHAAAAEAFGGARVDEFVQNLFSRVLESATPIIEDYALQARAA